MSPKHSGKLAFLLVGFIAAAALPMGCFNLAPPFPFLGEHIKEPEYPLNFKEGAKKDKEIVVALFVSIAPGMGSEYTRSEVALAADIAKKLPEMAKEKSQKLSVIDPVQINKFAMKTTNFVHMHPCEWGWNLGADYVLTVHLEKMSFHEVIPGSKTLVYEGRADVSVDVFDVDDGPTQPKYHYILPFRFPQIGYFDDSSIPLNRFKKDFLEHLATEICGKHVRHKKVDEITDSK